MYILPTAACWFGSVLKGQKGWSGGEQMWVSPSLTGSDGAEQRLIWPALGARARRDESGEKQRVCGETVNFM